MFVVVHRNIANKNHGESEMLVETELVNIKRVLCEYISENIYNADELGLFYKLPLNQTLAAKVDKAKGTKEQLDRVTVLLATKLIQSNQDFAVVHRNHAKSNQSKLEICNIAQKPCKTYFD